MQINRKMLLDRFQLAEVAAAGDPEANIAPININNDPNITFRSPFEYIYARYDRRPDLQVTENACVRCNRSHTTFIRKGGVGDGVPDQVQNNTIATTDCAWNYYCFTEYCFLEVMSRGSSTGQCCCYNVPSRKSIVECHYLSTFSPTSTPQ